MGIMSSTLYEAWLLFFIIRSHLVSMMWPWRNHLALTVDYTFIWYHLFFLFSFLSLVKQIWFILISILIRHTKTGSERRNVSCNLLWTSWGLWLISDGCLNSHFTHNIDQQPCIGLACNFKTTNILLEYCAVVGGSSHWGKYHSLTFHQKDTLGCIIQVEVPLNRR